MALPRYNRLLALPYLTLPCFSGRRLNETAFNGLRPVVASVMLRTPIVGHILRLIGAVSASPGAMDDALRKGHSLSIVSDCSDTVLNLRFRVELSFHPSPYWCPH